MVQQSDQGSFTSEIDLFRGHMPFVFTGLPGVNLKVFIISRWSILGPLCFVMQHHIQATEQHKETMLIFSKLQFGVLQTFLTAKKQREEKDQESEIEPGEV